MNDFVNNLDIEIHLMNGGTLNYIQLYFCKVNLYVIAHEKNNFNLLKQIAKIFR